MPCGRQNTLNQHRGPCSEPTNVQLTETYARSNKRLATHATKEAGATLPCTAVLPNRPSSSNSSRRAAAVTTRSNRYPT